MNEESPAVELREMPNVAGAHVDAARRCVTLTIKRPLLEDIGFEISWAAVKELAAHILNAEVAAERELQRQRGARRLTVARSLIINGG